MWQFLCDSWYDLFHLHDKYGQKTLKEWWETRKAEWLGFEEYNRRQDAQ